MRHIVTSVGIGLAALIGGGLAGSMATRTMNTPVNDTSVNQASPERTTNQNQSGLEVRSQAQPIIDRRTGSGEGSFRRKRTPGGIPQKYNKHTNRVRCKHKARLKRRKTR